MSLVIAVIVGFVWLESPLRWVLIAGALLWEGFEISIFLKWRKVKSTTGHEALVGTTGRTVTPCRPEGQARVRGQLWTVNCEAGANSNEDVVVTGTDGIRLTVAPSRTIAPRSRDLS